MSCTAEQSASYFSWVSDRLLAGIENEFQRNRDLERKAELSATLAFAVAAWSFASVRGAPPAAVVWVAGVALIACLVSTVHRCFHVLAARNFYNPEYPWLLSDDVVQDSLEVRYKRVCDHLTKVREAIEALVTSKARDVLLAQALASATFAAAVILKIADFLTFTPPTP